MFLIRGPSFFHFFGIVGLTAVAFARHVQHGLGFRIYRVQGLGLTRV